MTPSAFLLFFPRKTGHKSTQNIYKVTFFHSLILELAYSLSSLHNFWVNIYIYIPEYNTEPPEGLKISVFWREWTILAGSVFLVGFSRVLRQSESLLRFSSELYIGNCLRSFLIVMIVMGMEMMLMLLVCMYVLWFAFTSDNVGWLVTCSISLFFWKLLIFTSGFPFWMSRSLRRRRVAKLKWKI